MSSDGRFTASERHTEGALILFTKRHSFLSLDRCDECVAFIRSLVRTRLGRAFLPVQNGRTGERANGRTGERANGANTLNEGRWRQRSHRAVYPETVRIRDAAVRTAHTRLFTFS